MCVSACENSTNLDSTQNRAPTPIDPAGLERIRAQEQQAERDRLALMEQRRQPIAQTQPRPIAMVRPVVVTPPPVVPPPSLANIRSVQQSSRAPDSVVFFDGWTGMSGSHEYAVFLQRDGSQYRGLLKCDFFGATAYQPISLSSGIVASVTQRLATLTATDRRYRAHVTHTDDYPHVAIALNRGADTLIFYSRSQGDGHSPWGIGLVGQSYALHLDSAIPDQLIRSHARSFGFDRCVAARACIESHHRNAQSRACRGFWMQGDARAPAVVAQALINPPAAFDWPNTFE